MQGPQEIILTVDFRSKRVWDEWSEDIDAAIFFFEAISTIKNKLQA